jgi:hypothetical protein
VDLHLAKRHYDSSAEAHPDAKWPAQIGLFSLRIASFFTPPISSEETPVSTQGQGEENQVDRERSATRPSPTTPKKSKASKKASKSKKGSNAVDIEWLWMDEIMALDTFIMVGLSSVLFLVLQLRYHQREVDRQLRHGGVGVLPVPAGGGEGQPLDA